MPRIWGREVIVVVPKTKNPLEDLKSYCPISLVCVHIKMLEGLIHAHVNPIIDALLPEKQPSFQHIGQLEIRSPYLRKPLRIAFRVKRLELFVDITAA